jgi:hypothetical protein
MGLDPVSLIIQVEVTFGVHLTDEDVARVASTGTVGKLYECVVEKLGENPRPRRLEGPVYDHLRRALVDVFDTPEGWIAPDSRLDELLPPGPRRRQWKRLGEALGLNLPPLRRPAWLERLIARSTLLLFLVGALALFLNNPVRDVVWLLLALLLATGLKSAVAFFLTRPFAVCLPASCATVEGLTRTLLRYHYGSIARREQGWDAEEVWEILQDVLVDGLGVKREQVTADAHLGRDLGAA